MSSPAILDEDTDMATQPDTATEHQRFTVSTTAYLRNLDHEDLRAECIAIHAQNPPVRNEATGTTSFGLRVPALIVAGYLEVPREVADRVAAILNKYWDETA